MSSPPSPVANNSGPLEPGTAQKQGPQTGHFQGITARWVKDYATNNSGNKQKYYLGLAIMAAENMEWLTELDKIKTVPEKFRGKKRKFGDPDIVSLDGQYGPWSKAAKVYTFPAVSLTCVCADARWSSDTPRRLDGALQGHEEQDIQGRHLQGV